MPTINRRRTIITSWTERGSQDGFPPATFNTKHEEIITNLMDSRTGVSNPNWKEQVRNGVTATTPMSGVKYTYEVSDGSMSATRPLHPGTQDGLLGHWSVDGFAPGLAAVNFSFGFSTEVSANNQALARLIQDVQSQETKSQGLVFLGELRETIQLIKSPLKALREGVDSYYPMLRRRSKGVKRSKLSDVVSGTWLEWQFAMKPLAHDVEDNIAALRHIISQEVNHSIVSGKGQDEGGDTVNLGQTNANSFIISLLHIRKDTVTVRYKGAWKPAIEPTSVSPVTAFGLGTDQWIPAAWELLPWSFLIDYFTNVGDILSTTFVNTSGVSWLNKTVRRERKVHVTASLDKKATNIAMGDYASIGGAPGWAKLNQTTVTRSPGVITTPSLQLKVPGSNVKWLNIAALAAMASSNKRNPYY